jgi:hypothetical protein
MVKNASAHHEDEFDEFFFETGTHKIQGDEPPLKNHFLLRCPAASAG